MHRGAFRLLDGARAEVGKSKLTVPRKGQLRMKRPKVEGSGRTAGPLAVELDKIEAVPCCEHQSASPTSEGYARPLRGRDSRDFPPVVDDPAPIEQAKSVLMDPDESATPRSADPRSMKLCRIDLVRCQSRDRPSGDRVDDPNHVRTRGHTRPRKVSLGGIDHFPRRRREDMFLQHRGCGEPDGSSSREVDERGPRTLRSGAKRPPYDPFRPQAHHEPPLPQVVDVRRAKLLVGRKPHMTTVGREPCDLTGRQGDPVVNVSIGG